MCVPPHVGPWLVDSRHALTQREVELLQTSDQRVEEMRQAASETAKLHLRAISELEAAHHSETNNLQEAHLRAISELEAAHHSETGKLQEAHLNQDESEMRKLQEAHLRAISELEAAHHSELSTARADVESSAARLSAQEEELSWLEEGKVARESELADLRQRLAALQDEKGGDICLHGNALVYSPHACVHAFNVHAWWAAVTCSLPGASCAPSDDERVENGRHGASHHTAWSSACSVMHVYQHTCICTV